MTFDIVAFFGTDVFSWIILPLLIFFARIFDVSLGTLRILFISRGFRNIAPLIGFFEILIWILVIAQIMQNLNNPLTYIAYAAGFMAGTYIGMRIENRLAMGTAIIRIITRRDATRLVDFLRSEGHEITTMPAEGQHGPVMIIFSVILRHDIPNVVKVVKQFNPRAVYTIEDVRQVSDGVHLPPKSWHVSDYVHIHSFGRKAK